MVRREISIERLVEWTYRDQQAHLLAGLGLYEGEAAVDRVEPHAVTGGMRGVEMLGRLGCLIDLTGGGGADLPPDANTVHVLVQSLPGPWAEAVFHYGRSGGRPDWRPGARFRIGPSIRTCYPHGMKRPAAEVIEIKGNHGARYCPIVKLDRPQIVDQYRKVWTDWVSGLSALRLCLIEGRITLQMHVLNGQLPPLTPWDDPELVEKALISRLAAVAS